MCPMVPTLTCGFERSNFSFDMPAPLRCYEYPNACYLFPGPPSPFALRWTTFVTAACQPKLVPRQRAKVGADDRNRTGDLVLTKDALCQLSYIGELKAPNWQLHGA